MQEGAFCGRRLFYFMMQNVFAKKAYGKLKADEAYDNMCYYAVAVLLSHALQFQFFLDQF